MRISMRFVCGIGGTLAVVSLLAMVAPKAAHAVTAALVQVENTRSNPVPAQDVDQPGRHPFTLFCEGISAPCNTAAVPANTEFVIQSASVYVTAESAFASITSVNGGNDAESFIPVVPQLGASWVNTMALTKYADPGTVVSCDAAGPVDYQVQCTLEGYLVSLP